MYHSYTPKIPAAANPVNATIAHRPTFRIANNSKSSSVNVVKALVTEYVANRVHPRPINENGGYDICSTTFKPVRPQFVSPNTEPYIAARPFTTSIYGKFGPGGGPSFPLDAFVVGRFRLLFFGGIVPNCSLCIIVFILPF